MHSSLVRLQNAFGFFTTVAFTVAAFVALSVVLFPQDPSASVTVRTVQVVKGRSSYFDKEKKDFAVIKFDLDADFTSLFNWNTKQLFVYVLATYPSANASLPMSQSVIWDKIINSKSQLNPWDPISPVLERFSSQKTDSKKRPPHRSGRGLGKAVLPPGKLSLRNEKPKYQITDPNGIMAERANVTLEVGWNVQPWVGLLTWTRPAGRGLLWLKSIKGGVSERFDIPAHKGKKTDTPKTAETPAAAKASPIL